MTEQISNENIPQIARQMLDKAQQETDESDDAIDLLKADHDEAQDLFKKYWDAESAAEKQLLATQLALALSVHMRIEEDIFYPAVSRALLGADKPKDKDDLIVPEAKLEHESLKKLIGEVESASDKADFDAHVQVMCEYTNHHIKEEENKMFDRAKDCGLDMDDLGRQIRDAKAALLSRMSDGSGIGSLPSALFRSQTAHSGLGIADRR